MRKNWKGKGRKVMRKMGFEGIRSSGGNKVLREKRNKGGEKKTGEVRSEMKSVKGER